MNKLAVFVIITLTLLSSCGTRQSGSDNPVLTVTIQPLYYFATELAGDRFEINTLVPPGADHHSFDPAPKQIQELERSSILFINGKLGFEDTWVPRFRQNYPDLTIVDLSDGLELIEVESGEGGHVHVEGDDHHHHKGAEPHYWLSPRETRKMVVTLANTLKRMDPSGEAIYEANLKKLVSRIDSLDQVFEEELKSLTKRSFIIFHPALTYLERDYHLTQIAMELDGKEPTATHFRNLVTQARKSGINTIFVQREYDQGNAVALAREINARIVTIDPMSSDWLQEMTALLEKLKQMQQ